MKKNLQMNKLLRKVYNKADTIRKAVIKKYRFKGRNPQYKDYPAVIVACGIINNNSSIKVEHSRSCQNYTYVDKILNRLILIGEIGHHSNIPGCKNLVGHCAEPHAANEVLKSYPNADASNLIFSPAIRPRTMQIIPYCDNCIATFEQLNDE